MKYSIYYIISVLWLLTGCIKEGEHKCDPPKGLLNLEKFDWSLTDTPDDGTRVKVIITDENGETKEITAGSDGTVIELEDGTYTAVAVEEVDGVDYEDNKVKVDVTDDGDIPEVPPFNVGQTTIVIKDGEINEGETIYMIRQSRELVVLVRILSEYGFFTNIESLNGVLEGVTTSRDILMGFPPQPATGREMEKSTYASLNMTLAKNKEVTSPITYTFRRQLLGIESGIDKSLTLTATNFNGNEGEVVLSSFDVKEMLEGFHTENPDEPYVLILEMEEDASSGTIKIKDWIIGDENDLIAEEQ